MIRKSVTVFAAVILLAACQTDSSSLTGTTSAADALTARQSGSPAETADQRRADLAEQRAYTAPIGQQVTWSNPQTGNSGIIIPIKDGYAQNGAYCREFQQTTTIDGQQKQRHGTSCQQPDGTWKIVSQ